jgi:predicted signal transduction protein with EAL and GGDEF domain
MAREEDTVARLSGDEFAVLFEVAQPLDVSNSVDRLLAALGEPLTLQGQEVAASASVGIALYPDDGADMATLEKNAETAMYRAKEQGDSFQFFHREMAKRAQERLIIETNLRRAMERGQLFLNFQPIIDLQTGDLAHAEVLLRWRHPELGLVPPDRFIPVAEASGLIAAMGEWVLRETCRQIRAWEREGLSVPRIAVNLSARQLRQRDLAESFAAIMDGEGVLAARIGVELTESALMQNADEAAAILGRMRALGLEIAVDDFGTGYSSLSYIKRFPIDKLKIDRSFVKDLSAREDGSGGGMAIVSAILGVARALDMKVVAEGIETREQIDLLRRAGCDQGQGYHIARPMAAGDFAAWARQLKGLDSAA